MQSSQQLCERPCTHRTISPHVDARSAVAAAVESFCFSATDKSAEIILFVLAGSTIRAEAILALTYSRARHTLLERVSVTCEGSASMTISSRKKEGKSRCF